MPSRVRAVRGRRPVRGHPARLTDSGRGRVWGDERPDRRGPWRLTATGPYRHLGDPPSGAQPVEPTLEDGYILLARREHRS